MNLTNTQQLVLSKFKPSADAREGLEPGEFEEEFYLRVHGQCKLGKPYESTVAASVPWQQLATYLLGQVNAATRKKLVREFLEAHADGKVRVDADALKAEAQAAVEEILGATTKTCAGKLTGSVMVSIVTADELAVA